MKGAASPNIVDKIMIGFKPNSARSVHRFKILLTMTSQGNNCRTLHYYGNGQASQKIFLTLIFII